MDNNGLEHLVPSVAGSAGALMWIKGTPKKKICMLILGATASYYLTPDVARYFDWREGSVGFLVGLFSMTLVDLAFRSIEVLDVPTLAKRTGNAFVDWVRKILGLPQKSDEDWKQ